MAKFSKTNFRLIINEIEEMEAADQNIWVPIGILEIMYEDYSGFIDKYFHSERSKRSLDFLWSNLTNNYHINWDSMRVQTVPLSYSKWEPCKGPSDYPFSPIVTCTCDDYKIDN